MKRKQIPALRKIIGPFICSITFLLMNGCSAPEPGRWMALVNSSNTDPQILQDIRKAAEQRHIRLDTTSNINWLMEDSLMHISSLIFIDVLPEALNYRQKPALQRFIEAGGSWMSVNERRDTVTNWPWLNALNDKLNASKDNYWQGKHENGKIFLAAHASPLSPQLVDKGTGYIADNGRPDYDDAVTLPVPEENRFVTEVLDTYMYEPMEMVIFKDGRVLFVERRGNIKLYDPAKKETRIVGCMDVNISGNYEDGILGVTLDPDFETNHWIYINYSPVGDVAKQNVSRFEMRGDSIIMSSEKIVLEIPTQRETCCHSGGHLTFGPGNNLYISTGDNTSSKESDGFTPIDERPGRMPFDAQKSSGNTHDLRGKILRIHPEANGTYTVPDGNLFPKDGSKGKPEIYVMGARNPFRFTVDPRNGYVYWGDVGPDGGVSSERGPQSYDEYNQAKSPGNYGWPYFVADNKAYADFDFATNKIGPKFNPGRPENNSPNNTGSKVLPPARKAMMWYSYGASPEFPELGQGSRSAMGGPLYYADDYKNAKSKFPEYYNGKWFIFEWARSFVKVVSFDGDTNYASVEPFLPSHEWYKPIDIKFGPDGAMYVLQYGANYFAHNPDSRLVKISYVAGNREPVAQIQADETVGAAPLTVNLSAAGSFDFDNNGQLKYSWNLQGGSVKNNKGDHATAVYATPGIYKPSVTVTDEQGKSSTAQLEIKVGNDRPAVELGTGGSNRSFYFDNEKLNYSVEVKDREDGTIGNGIAESDVHVYFDYLKEGKDLALLPPDSEIQGGMQYIKGKNLLEKSDCKTCHTLTSNSIGPAYSAIADRYKGKNVIETLAGKIISGGNGNWGENMMAAHPQHTKEEAAEMVKYILSVNEKQRLLPMRGTLAPDDHRQTRSSGYYVMRAGYTDRGATGIGPLSSNVMLILRNATVEAEDMVLDKKMNQSQMLGTNTVFVGNIRNGAYMSLPEIDLTDIGSVEFRMFSRVEGSMLELRLDSANGTLLGQLPLEKKERGQWQQSKLPVKPVWGRRNIYLVFRNGSGTDERIAFIDWMKFNKK